MKVTQVKCPKCGTAITMKERDKLFLCSQCNTMHIRDGAVETVAFDIAEFGPASRGEGIYVPFWKFTCSMVIRAMRSEGGTFSKLAAWVKGGDNKGGNLFVYVPAAELDPGTFKRLAMMLTEMPPNYSTRFNFGGVKNMPAVISKAEATELADFVVVTMEAEQPGILQQLDYTLTISEAKVVYLPFANATTGLMPAL